MNKLLFVFITNLLTTSFFIQNIYADAKSVAEAALAVIEQTPPSQYLTETVAGNKTALTDPKVLVLSRALESNIVSRMQQFKDLFNSISLLGNNAWVNTPNRSKPCSQVLQISNKKFLYIKYPAGTFDIRHGANTDGYDGLIVEGAGKNLTTIDYTNWTNGAEAFVSRNNGSDTQEKYLLIRELTIKGGYSDSSTLADKNQKQAAWQNGVFAGFHRTAYVENVNIAGFYYAINSSEQGKIYARGVSVLQSGDVGFFSYAGGKLYVFDSDATSVSDRYAGLGFGYGAESIAWYASDPLKYPSGTVGWYPGKFNYTGCTEPKALDNPCLTKISDSMALEDRGYLFIRDSSGSKNRYYNVMSNMGSIVDIARSPTLASSNTIIINSALFF
jgi:hypothetical protein